MKKIIFIVFCFLTQIAFAQSINQLDTNGKRHGIWQKNFTKTEILRYQGEFVHGKEIGVFKFYKKIDSKAVLTATRTFNADNDIADVKFFSSSKKIIGEGKMRGKTYVGRWVYYHNKSRIIMTDEYYDDNGELSGVRITNYKTGKIAEKATYKFGVLNGESLWYSGNGNVLKSCVYLKGKLQGLAKTFDFKGNLESEGVYRDNRRHGIWKFYKNGKFLNKKDFTRKSKNPYKQNKK